jgi:hypothetical protein
MISEVPCKECASALGAPNAQPVDAGCQIEKLLQPTGSPLSSSTPAAINPPSTKAAGSGVVLKTSVKVMGKPAELDRNEGFETKVSDKEIEESAGAFGNPSRFMQLLPGVVSDNDQFNDFLVRGGNPDETLFVIDNIEAPSINQLALSDTTWHVGPRMHSERATSIRISGRPRAGVLGVLAQDQMPRFPDGGIKYSY